MAVIVLPLANQVQRQFADFPDIDMKFASKADFETAIKNTPRIPDGWLAYCVTEKKWYQADKTAGTANSIAADTDQVPSPGSANPVQSGGVYNALFNKADTGKNPGNINDMNLIGDENRGGFFRMDFDNTPIKNFPETTNCALVMQQGSIVRGLRLMSSYEKDNFYVQRANNNWGAAYKLLHSGNLDEFGIATQSGVKTYVQLTYNSTTNTYSGSLTPAITNYTVGLSVTVRVPAANNAINTQLALNGLASVQIYKNNGTSLDVGELQSGYYTLVYGANSAFYLQGATAQPASFSKLSGVPDDNAALKAALSDAKSRANHTGTQLASTISDFANTVLATVASGLSTVAGAPVATDNLITVLSKFKYLYDNLGLLVRAVSIGTLSLNNAEINSSDTLTTFFSKVFSFIANYRNRYYIQVAGLSFLNASSVTYVNSYQDGQRFDIRPVNGDTNGVANPNGATTLNINSIGALPILSNGLPLSGGELLLGQIYTVIYNSNLNAFQLETPTNRLSINNNPTLAGDDGGVPLLSLGGKFIRTTFLKFLTATRELTIGDANNPGKLTVFSNVFKLQVQDNIGDGQASIVINARQDKAFQIVDKLGNVYMLFRTLASGAGVVVSKLWIFDQNVGSPLYRAQATVASNGAGTKVYATKGDAANTQYSIDMATDTLVCALNFRLKVYDVTGSKIIHAKWEGTLKRVGGVISIAGTPDSKTLCDNGTNSGFAFGVEPKADNSGLLLYFMPGSGDSTAYTGSFYDINYSI